MSPRRAGGAHSIASTHDTVVTPCGERTFVTDSRLLVILGLIGFDILTDRLILRVRLTEYIIPCMQRHTKKI